MSVETAQQKAMADQVMQAIQGQTIASKLMHELRAGCAPQDALLEAIRDAREGERLRGFARALQKALERA